MVRRDENDLPVRDADGWVLADPDRAAGGDRFLWTDDRSNLVGLLRGR
jgi:hypothetical protein